MLFSISSLSADTFAVAACRKPAELTSRFSREPYFSKFVETSDINGWNGGCAVERTLVTLLLLPSANTQRLLCGTSLRFELRRFRTDIPVMM